MYGAFNQAKRRCRRFRLTAPVVVAAGLLLSSAAVAQVYPVNGVFSAIDTNFPDRNGACLALKAFGIEDVSKQAVPSCSSSRTTGVTTSRAMPTASRD